VTSSLGGKVALISGAARGQGRSHARLLAELGADVVGFDICRQLPSVGYPMATREDLDETARLVAAAGRRMLAAEADVRDLDAVTKLVERAYQEFGHIDIVIANAGIFPAGGRRRRELSGWHDAIDVMLTGVFNTVWPVKDRMVAQGTGGSIVLVSSTAGLKGLPADGSTGSLGYVAAKHGVVGLMRAWANELGPHGIRVNSVHPSGVNTPMVVNEAFQQFLATHPEASENMRNVLPVDLLEPEDVSHAIAYLVADQGRYVTGQTLGVDAGYNIR
jgi:SDR family mycofactocin-dependent oxidoreductase